MSYAILQKNYYYAGTLGRPADGYLTDEDQSEILEFDSQEEAQAYLLDEIDSDGRYYLSHGEYARPTYEIVDLSDRPDCVEVYKPGETWGHYRKVIREDQIPLPIRKSITTANVDFDSSDGELEEWSYQEEYNGSIYGITYFVHTEASQRAGLTGDMSNVDWDFPTFWAEFGEEMTIAQAEEYAAEVGEPVTGRAIRHAAKAGYVPGARKNGRDWLIPYEGINHYLDNRPKPGRKPTA
jgi:hypothetical protein